MPGTSKQGPNEGLWHVDFAPALVIELLFGPIVFRALNGGIALTPDEAAALARTAWRGMEAEPNH